MADTPKTEIKRKGREHYSHDKADARIAKRREEAEARQTEHDSLTTKEKITKATSRRGNSTKEIQRLKARLEKEKEKAPPKVEPTEPVAESPKPKKAYQKPKKS